tara:strand:+ start:3505 stop:6600 length:3096 start_codon:yes stop_codon:yes gene_type:complete
MATWKKVLVSGSSIAVNELTASGHINAFTSSVHSIGPITSSGGISASGNYVGKSTAVSFIGTSSFADSAEGGTLADGKILIGNGSNVTTAVTPSGDASISNTGVIAIGSGVIINADVKSDAAIVQTKINTNVDLGGNITFGNQTNDTVTFTGPISATNITATGNTALGNATGDTVTILGNITSSGTTTLGNAASDFITIRGNITGSANGTISQSRIITEEITGSNAITGLTLSGNVTASGQIVASLGFRGNVVGTSTGVVADAIDGDAIADNAVDTEHIADDAIEEEHIGDGEVKTAAIANDAVTADKLASNAVVNASVASSAAIAYSKLAAMTNANILVGNGSNVPAVVAVSGDVSLANNGAFTIGADKVDGSKLTNDVTIAQDLTVARDLVVARNISGSGNLDATDAFFSGHGHVVGNFTASGNISSSVTSTGSFGQIETPTGINFTDDNSSNQGAKIFFTGASSQDKIVIQAGTRNMLEIHNPYNASAEGEVVVNEDSLLIDFRVESADKSHMLYVDSTNNKVGIGAGAEPGEALEVVGNISASGTIRAGAGTTTGFIGTASFAGAIADDGITTAAIGDEQVTLAKLAHAAANTVLVRDANSAGDPSFKAVTNKQILIGDGTGFTAAVLSGDVTMGNNGAVAIEDDAVDADALAANAVVNASIAANAAIAHSKLAALASTKVLVGNGTNVATEVALSGDVTMANNGAVTIEANAVDGSKLSDNVTIAGNFAVNGTTALGNGTADTVTILGNITHSGTTTLGNAASDFVTMTGNLTGSAGGTISQSRIFTDTIKHGHAETGLTLNSNVTASGQVSASLGFIADQLAIGFIGTASYVNSFAGAGITNGKFLVGNGSGVGTEVNMSGDATMANNGAVTIEANAVDGSKLADDIVIAGNLTVTSDLIVNGDTTQLSVTNLNVDDQFILLNSGSNSGDGGIIVQTAGAGGTHIGAGLGFDDSLARWVISAKDQIAHNATAFAPNAQGAPQMLVAVSASASPPSGNPTDFGAAAASRVGMMHVETDTGDIYIFS